MIQLHRQLPHVRQTPADGALLLHGTDNEQEAATAGAGQLGALRPRVERPADRDVDLAV